MVQIQSYIFTPVGTPISIVAMPNVALMPALCPMVKKWCTQTVNDKKAIAIVASTSDE